MVSIYTYHIKRLPLLIIFIISLHGSDIISQYLYDFYPINILGVDAYLDNISLILAFSAGLLSFLSPCVLPLVPAYISYLTGTAVNELDNKKAKLNVIYKSFGFVLGFSIIFILMGASITSLGKIFISNQMVFRKISGSSNDSIRSSHHGLIKD